MVLGESGLTLLDVHMNESWIMNQIFLKYLCLSNALLLPWNLFNLQSYDEETRGTKEYYEIWLEQCVLVFLSSLLLYLRHLNIACLLFKYSDLTVEAFYKLEFIPYKAEQPQQGMELQEKEAQKD